MIYETRTLATVTFRQEADGPKRELVVSAVFKMVEDVSGVPAPKRFLSPRAALAVSKTVHFVGHRVLRKQLHLVPDPVVIEMGTSHWKTDSTLTLCS